MRNASRNIFRLFAGLVMLFIACEDEVDVPKTGPLKAEIKQVIVNNSIHTVAYIDEQPENPDTVIITVPEGSDITQLDLDIVYSYFGSIEPQPGVVDLTTPLFYTVTSNTETREYVVEVRVVPPYLSSFRLTSPVDAVAIIEDTTISFQVIDGVDLSAVEFAVEYFGESVVPDISTIMDLTADDPTLKVINQEFETTYYFDITYIGRIIFQGIIYDATVVPNDFLPGSVDDLDLDGWAVEEDAFAYKGSVVHFTSLADDNNQAEFDYGELGLRDEPNQVTTILRIKGIDDSGENYAEMQFVLGDKRAKLLVRNDRIEVIGAAKTDVRYSDFPGFSPTEWNTYRVTVDKITDDVVLYLNEDFTPLLTEKLYGGTGNRHLFGDGGGKLYECLFDYIAIDTEGAYSPEDLPLNEILDQD